MTPLRALRMPFDLTGLLFVGITATLAGFALAYALGSPPGTPGWIISILVLVLMVVWITRYAFHLIDEAANGVTEAPVASAEMLSPLGDARCWVHPLLAAFVVLLLYFNPAIPGWPVGICALALFPASVGAMAISGRALDAFNPLAMAKVIAGLGHYYALVLLLDVVCIVLIALLLRAGLWNAASIGIAELLLLMTCTFTGGAIHARRNELDFAPRLSPERVQDREDAEYARRRQEVIDALYRDLRVREPARAVANARSWLTAAQARELHGNVQVLLEASKRWNEPREFPKLLRGLVPVLLELRQPALAFQLAEAGLAANPGFAPTGEAETLALIRYAQHTGRRRVARALLDNYLAATPAPQPGAELRALQTLLAEKQ
jgi:hypothetical protein